MAMVGFLEDTHEDFRGFNGYDNIAHVINGSISTVVGLEAQMMLLDAQMMVFVCAGDGFVRTYDDFRGTDVFPRGTDDGDV